MIPKNLQFEFEYFCDGCPCMDPRVEQTALYAEGKVYRTINTITCKRIEGCRAVIENFKKQGGLNS